uniref:Uncharacterized protein n=1 Tax=Rhizophora mucronata TaxID=61149 RepID=A0A2P2JRP7_RHIMU
MFSFFPFRFSFSIWKASQLLDWDPEKLNTAQSIKNHELAILKNTAGITRLNLISLFLIFQALLLLAYSFSSSPVYGIDFFFLSFFFFKKKKGEKKEINAVNWG